MHHCHPEDIQISDTGLKKKNYEEPGLDDAADVVAAALHVDLQLLRVPVLRKQGHCRGGDLTVPRKVFL